MAYLLNYWGANCMPPSMPGAEKTTKEDWFNSNNLVSFIILTSSTANVLKVLWSVCPIIIKLGFI